MFEMICGAFHHNAVNCFGNSPNTANDALQINFAIIEIRIELRAKRDLPLLSCQTSPRFDVAHAKSFTLLPKSGWLIEIMKLMRILIRIPSNGWISFRNDA